MTGRLGRYGLLVAAVVVVVGWMVAACSTAGGSERLVADPETRGSEGEVEYTREEPEDECWDGALDGEPVACFVLEQAEADGALQVEAIFEAPSGPLYVVLAQSEPIDDVLLSVLRDKFLEFVVTPDRLEAYGMELECREYVDLGSCVDDVFGSGPWHLSSGDSLSIFSYATSTHDDVILIPGGTEGRRRVPGWGSWVQLWPKPEVGANQASGASAVERFDVSDVDTVNGLSDEDCESHEYVVNTGSCGVWRNLGEWGYVGMHGPHFWIQGERNVVYVQLTAPIPDESQLREFELGMIGQAAREVYESGEMDFEYIEVKYGLGQLWRWAVILDRFKYSKANTVGIVFAALSTNGVPPNRPQDIRETISVSALDPELVRAALPELLPALGIPVDAVGRIRHRDTDLRRYRDRWPLADETPGLENSTQAPEQVAAPVSRTFEDSPSLGVSDEADSDDEARSGSSEGAATPTTAEPLVVVEDSDGGEASGRVEGDTGEVESSDAEDAEVSSAEAVEAPVTASEGLAPGAGGEDQPALSEGAVASSLVGNEDASDRSPEISSEEEETAVAQSGGQDSAGASGVLLVATAVVGALLVAGLVILGVRRVRTGGGAARS